MNILGGSTDFLKPVKKVTGDPRLGSRASVRELARPFSGEESMSSNHKATQGPKEPLDTIGILTK